MIYSRCSRCELNYVQNGEIYCQLCKKELSGQYCEDSEINLEENICPYCEKHRLEFGEEMCTYCLHKKLYKDKKRSHNHLPNK